MRLCKFTFIIISSLPCLQTFWHAIPTSFYILNVFLSLFDKVSLPVDTSPLHTNDCILITSYTMNTEYQSLCRYLGTRLTHNLISSVNGEMGGKK